MVRVAALLLGVAIFVLPLPAQEPGPVAIDGTVPGEPAYLDAVPGDPPPTDVTYVDITGGSSNNSWPWSTSLGSSMRFQMMYTASEIGRAGRIVEFGFMNGTTSTRYFYNVTIKMCHTSISSVTTAMNSNYGGNTPDTVFYADTLLVGSGTSGGWNVFTLDNGFQYNGTSNLLVEIVWNGAASGVSITSRYMTQSPTRRTWVWNWQDSTGVMADASRYNARFGFVDSLDDVGVSYLEAPPSLVDSGTTLTPACSVYNYGTTTVSYNARMTIGTGYDQTSAVTAHASGTARYVTFPSWTAQTLGNVAVVCSTELTGDGNQSNDSIYQTTFVRKRDVGASCLLVPALVVDSGVPVVPACSVYNYGNQAESYNVRMTIGSAYDTVAAVSSHAPGAAQYVAFPSWTPDVLGNVAVVCSTELDGDFDPGNDSLMQTTFVRKCDAGVVSISSPSGSYLPGDTAFPAATWHNYGNAAADFEAWVMLLDPTDAQVYRQKVDLAGLAPGADTLVGTFPPYVLTASGDWVVRCSTGLAGDMNAANDEREAGFVVVSVGHPDLGVKLIEAPKGRVDTMVDVTPQARLRNYGDVEAEGRAWFVMFDPTDAEVYRESVDVAPIPVNEEVSAVFPVFNVGANAGDWTTRCSVYVAGDVGPGNDVLEDGFTVSSFPDWPFGWVEVASMPAGANTVKDGAWLAYDDGSQLVYGTKGNKTGEFYAYDAWADAWATLAPIPDGTEGKPPRKGARGACDGQGAVYATKGNNTLGFWKYSITANSWEQLPDVPEGASGKKVKGGTDLAFVEKEGVGYVYLLKGYKTEFYRYNTATNAWEPLEDMPWVLKEKWDKGSWLAHKEGRGHGTDPYLYAHQAKYYDRAIDAHQMFRYDLARDSWDHTPLHGMPLYGLHGGRIRKKKAKDGSAGAYHDGMIYALKGGNSQQFYAYDIAADTWTELDTIPTFGSTARRKRVKAGADLVSWGGGAFFALKGNKTNEFWRYMVAPVPGRQPERNGAMAGRTGAMPLGVTCSPNPLTAGRATVRYSLPHAGAARLSVFDVTGRSVITRSLVAQRTGAVSLDVRGLSAGIYLVKLEAEGWNSTAKLVVQR